jgi:hypothetical protein
MKRVLKKLALTTPATIYFDDESNKMSVANLQVWIWDMDIENKILALLSDSRRHKDLKRR